MITRVRPAATTLIIQIFISRRNKLIACKEPREVSLHRTKKKDTGNRILLLWRQFQLQQGRKWESIDHNVKDEAGYSTAEVKLTLVYAIRCVVYFEFRPDCRDRSALKSGTQGKSHAPHDSDGNCEVINHSKAANGKNSSVE